MYESATGPLGDGTAFSPGSTAASQTDPRVNGANYFKPGEAGDPLFDAATGTSTRFRADAIAASLNIDAGSSLSVKQMTGGGLITLTGSGGSGAALTLNNAATPIASSAGQVTYAGDTLSTLTVGTNQTFTLSGGVVTPAAAVTFSKAGTGTMIVNGPTNLGAGSTFRIDGGTVRFNGVGTGTGAVLVSNTATIGGIGTIPGAVTIASGGAVAPGNSVGLLSTGAETWQPNSKYLFEYASTDQAAVSAAPPGTLNDSLNIAGALAINATNVAGQKFTIDIAPFGLGSTPVQYVLATATSISGFSADKFAFTGTGFAAGTAQVLLGGPSNNQLILQFQPVPEPAWVLLACGGLAGVVGWVRRRRAA
jgi:fibronectin-binding autotransporter adhesin